MEPSVKLVETSLEIPQGAVVAVLTVAALAGLVTGGQRIVIGLF